MSLVSVKLHGILGKKVGKDWFLDICSVGEAVGAIEVLSNEKLFKTIVEQEKNNTKYQILVNKRPVDTSSIDQTDINSIQNSELTIQKTNIKSIDIVPVIEGSDADILGIVLGIVLIAISPFTGPLAPFVAVAGLGLIAGGIVGLLSKPPKFDDFDEFKSGGKSSYLFSGPVNTTREGGPVPVGYGRLMVGSQTISTSLVTRDVENDEYSESQDNKNRLQEEGILWIHPVELPTMTKNQSFSQILTLMNVGNIPQQTPNPSYTWSLVEGTLPNGISVSQLTNSPKYTYGKLSGTPTESGTFKFTVQITNGSDITITRQYTVTIA